VDSASTTITVRTASGRDLARSWLSAGLFLVGSLVLLSGPWIAKALGVIGLLLVGSEGTAARLETARWRRAGRVELRYDWGDAVPGRTLPMVLTSDRPGLADLTWTVRLTSVQTRRRHGVKRETPLWAGPGQVTRVERTAAGSLLKAEVAIPLPQALAKPEQPGVTDWRIHWTGTAGKRSVTVDFEIGVQESPLGEFSPQA
jgi:hypothetical protein